MSVEFGNKKISRRRFDYDVFQDSIDKMDVNKLKFTIHTINQYSYCLAKKDYEFMKALKDADVLLPDGISIVIAKRFLEGIKIKKIAGYDMHMYLLKKLNIKGGKCFYLGSTDNTLAKIEHNVSSNFPKVRVMSYAPPFKDKFDLEDNLMIAAKINQFTPDLLFIGMTAPKQEKWVYNNKHLIESNVICTIGAVFDFYAETIRRPSKFWINIGLEWFIRLFKEPKRMWKRYFMYGPSFFMELLKMKFL